MSLSESELADIEASIHPILASEKRAQELQPLVPHSHLFVGLMGVTYSEAPFELLPGFLTLRQVTNPPGIIHVCRAADLERADYLAIARYSHGVKVELAVGDRKRDGHSEAGFLHDLAWHAAGLLKLRGHHLLSCPASSTVSWDTVAAIENNSVQFRVLDDVPRQIALRTGQHTITPGELAWVRDHFNRSLRLREVSTSRRFGLAYNIAYSWNHTQEPRIAIGNLWCGLDALFGVKTDRPVTQKLVERIAAWVPGVSEVQVTDLYNHRCDAIHGRIMQDNQLGIALNDTVSLLFLSLTRCVEEGLPTLPDWDS